MTWRSPHPTGRRPRSARRRHLRRAGPRLPPATRWRSRLPRRRHRRLRRAAARPRSAAARAPAGQPNAARGPCRCPPCPGAPPASGWAEGAPATRPPAHETVRSTCPGPRASVPGDWRRARRSLRVPRGRWGRSVPWSCTPPDASPRPRSAGARKPRRTWPVPASRLSAVSSLSSRKRERARSTASNSACTAAQAVAADPATASASSPAGGRTNSRRTDPRARPTNAGPGSTTVGAPSSAAGSGRPGHRPGRRRPTDRTPRHGTSRACRAAGCVRCGHADSLASMLI